MKKPLLVVAHARSGSTYFCQLLAAFTRVRAYLEVFHGDPARMVAFLGEDWPLVRERLGLGDDPAAARIAVCDQPDRLVGCLAALHPDVTVSLKVFPSHLDERRLALLVPRCQGLIMLRRNLLHAYISRTIALTTGIWSLADTSRYRVRFVPEHFERHVAWVVRFQTAIGTIARSCGLPVEWLGYATLCRASDAEPVVRQLLAAVGVVDAGDFRRGSVGFTRQDRRDSALDKVVNAHELREYLAVRGLTSLLDSTDDGAILYDRLT